MRGSRTQIIILIVLALVVASFLFFGSPASLIRDHLESERQAQLTEKLDRLRNRSVGDLFIGDSMTARFRLFMEESDSTVNLGIGGETTAGLAARMDMIGTLRPRRVFVMVGINDLLDEMPVREVFSNYSRILARLGSDFSEAEIYVQGLLPVARGKGEAINARVRTLNAMLEEECVARKFVYLDLYAQVADEDRALRADLTTDGIHLNEQGYLRWGAAIARACSNPVLIFKQAFLVQVLHSRARLFLFSDGLVNDSLKRYCGSMWPDGVDNLRVAVVVNATSREDKRSKKLKRVRGRFADLGFDAARMEPFDLLRSPPDSLLEYDALYILGGNPFLLFRDFHDSGAEWAIRNLVLHGRVLMGYSAGAMLLGPGAWHMQAVDSLLGFNTNGESRLEGANLYPFLVFPHFGEFSREFEGLAALLEQYEKSAAYPVYRLNDGEAVLYDRGRVWKVDMEGHRELKPFQGP